MDPNKSYNGWGAGGVWEPKRSDNRNVIGGGLPWGTPGSRGSDAASPKAVVSGSAQLNHQSEAEAPRVWAPETTYWPPRDSIGAGRRDSGTASPSQLPNGYNNRTTANVNPRLGFHVSLDNGLAASRQSQTPINSMQHSFGASSRTRGLAGVTNLPATSGPARQDSLPNSFYSNQRSSISGPSVPNRLASFTEPLSTTFSNLDLSDGGVSDRTGDANLNPQTRPFQFNPSSQTWHTEPGTISRAHNSAYRVDDSYPDSNRQSFSSINRGSIDMTSPITGMQQNLFYGTPDAYSTTRAEYMPQVRQPWSQSRPDSRSSLAAQDSNRSASFSQVSAAFYPNQASYLNGFAAHQFQSLYGGWNQGSNIRDQVQVQYSMPPNVPSRQPGRGQDPGKGVRSVLLEEFRANNPRSQKKFELKDIYGHVLEFSGDQMASRWMQDKLVCANSDEKDQVFNEIRDNCIQLSKDVFGNYVIQKFFEHGSQIQKQILADAMMGKLTELSLQMYGCRVVQKALEHVLNSQLEAMVEELRPEVVRLCKDINGNHVVQKVLGIMPQMFMPKMMAEFQGQIHALCTQNYGCRVVQRMLEVGNAQQKSQLMEDIHACGPGLIPDHFGNYVAQWVLEQGSEEDKRRFVKLAINRLIDYSCHKFASNVVEKAVAVATAEERDTIIKKLVTPEANGRHPLDRIMADQYGNYVMQKIPKVFDGQERMDLLIEMKARFAALKKGSTVNSRQLQGIEKLLTGMADPQSPKFTGSRTGSAQRRSRGRNMPGRLDIDSTSPTPALTSENCSPKTTSSPSTKSGDDTIPEPEKMSIDPTLGSEPKVVLEDGAEN